MGFVRYFVYEGEGKIKSISMSELKLTPKLTNPGAMHGASDGIYVLNMEDTTFTLEEIEEIEIAIVKLKEKENEK